jgi:hypothetical protein
MENRIKLDENNKLIIDAICETDGTDHNIQIEGDYTISAKDVRKLLAGWNDKHIVHHSSAYFPSAQCTLTEIYTTSEDALRHFDERVNECKESMRKTSEKCDDVVKVLRKLYKLIVDHNEKHHSGFFNKGSKIEVTDDVRDKVCQYIWGIDK